METDWCQQLTEGLIENGCQYLSIALMENAQEVKHRASDIAERLKFPLFAEVTLSEKIGYEIALSYSYGKKRSAFLTHGFSLPVAMDPLMSSIYTGVAGGFLVIALDTTPSLPFSSGSDPVSLAMFAKMPVLELSGFQNLSSTLKAAYGLSERFETPVMLHIDTKVPRGGVARPVKTGKRRRTDFTKNPARWAATPRFRFLLHQNLNRRLKEIAEAGAKTHVLKIDGKARDLGIICNPANLEFITPWAKENSVSVLSVQMPFPLPVSALSPFIQAHKKVVILEDRFPTIQFQLPERKHVLGRMTDEALSKIFSWQKETLIQYLRRARTGKVAESEKAGPAPPQEAPPPSPLHLLLSGIKEKSPAPLLIADKTPLTAGLPVDHFVSRGGAISVMAGFAHAGGDGTRPPVLGLTDSSAFLHYGMQATTNAIYNTAPVKCLMLIRPEHEEIIKNFLGALRHVQLVPLNPRDKNARQKLLQKPSHLLTFFTLPMEVIA